MGKVIPKEYIEDKTNNRRNSVNSNEGNGDTMFPSSQ